MRVANARALATRATGLARSLATARVLGLGLALTAGLACRRVDEPIADMRTPPPDLDATTSQERPTNGGGKTFVVPDFARVAQQLSPSVVTVIATVQTKTSGTSRRTLRGVGSGMLVSARGQVLTNEHVVAGSSRVEVELSTRARLPARIVYADPLLDLALLEIDGLQGELLPVEFSSREPTPGEWVMAVGQPFGLGNTVTVGVISGLGRDHADLGRPPGLSPDGIWSFIQTDASVNVGNSGGPLVDPDGKVVGIATAVRADGQGLAFAIPSPMARHFLEEVWIHGRVRHTRLGMTVDDAVDGELPGRGSVVLVKQVELGGPAAEGGLMPGDFILKVDGQPVSRVSDVAYLAQLAGVGSKVSFEYKRGDAGIETCFVTPAAR
jgi:S1-C subfamily serine protease